MTLTRTDIRQLMERHDLAPSRALGQNFLCDGNTVSKIVRLAGVGPGDGVIEIGPGLGSLTVGLLAAGADVLAVEIDRYLVPALKEAVGALGDEPGSRLPTRLQLVQADVQEIDWTQALPETQEPSTWTVVANLPYNIATPLILDLLEHQPMFTDWLVMVQREAGERLTARPGSKTYGIPTVMLSYWADAEIVAAIGPDVFLPRPNVDSVLVKIRRRSEPAVSVSAVGLRRVVRKAFGQRRKMLRRSLSAIADDATFVQAGVDPTARPESLDLDAWARLVTAVESSPLASN